VCEIDRLCWDLRLALDNFMVVAGVRCCARKGRSWQNDDSQLPGGEREFKAEAAFDAGADMRLIRITKASGLLLFGVFSFERFKLLMS
jgi:hypothetical protein